MEKRHWKRTILALVILSAWSAQTASAELALTLTGRDGSPAEPGVIDSDLLHVTVNGATPPGVYRYRLISQPEPPAVADWEASPWRPFYQDLYLYRNLDTQWLRIDVVDGLGETLTAEASLLGGALTAPPDDPIDPVAWAASIERGLDVAYSEFNKRIDEYNEQGLVDLKIAGIDHVRVRTATACRTNSSFTTASTLATRRTRRRTPTTTASPTSRNSIWSTTPPTR